MPIYVDVHVLLSVPPSNLNRDDTGSPKVATYGGTRRSRVSSQAWKRATRKRFEDLVDPAALGTRTRRVSTLLAERIAVRGVEKEAAVRIATRLLTDLAIKPGKVANETAYLLFFGRPQLEALIDQVADRLPELAGLDDTALTEALAGVSARAVLGQGHPVDVALFGRMVADIPGLNVDAAAQVAHALSTHTVRTEFDYYTAVDDENTADETGAGMIGTVEFTSSTLYRYATVGVHQLLDNLGGDVGAALEALRVFLVAFTTSFPTGHQNSFAHRTAPHLVTLAVRGDQPVNLVSAFESPVHATDEGFASGSLLRFAEELRATVDTWGLRPDLVVSTYHTAEPEHAKIADSLGASRPFEQAVTEVTDAVRTQLTNG